MGDTAYVFTGIDHVGIACRDLDASIRFYCRAYGFAVTHIEVNEEQGVREAMLAVGDGSTSVQLLEPIRDDSPVARFLAQHGEGLHHLAFATADIADAESAAARAGARSVFVQPRPGTRGSRILFLHPKDCGGVLTELVQPAAPPEGHPSG